MKRSYQCILSALPISAAALSGCTTTPPLYEQAKYTNMSCYQLASESGRTQGQLDAAEARLRQIDFPASNHPGNIGVPTPQYKDAHQRMQARLGLQGEVTSLRSRLSDLQLLEGQKACR